MFNMLICLYVFSFLLGLINKNEVNCLDTSKFIDASSLPIEQQEYINAEYEKFMKQRRKDSKAKEDDELLKQKESMMRPPKGISPMELGLKRDESTREATTSQVLLNGGSFYFGTQMGVGNKLLPGSALKDGAEPRKLVSVKPFRLDIDCVTNKQFKSFVDATSYVTEAELYGWSFVLDNQVSDDIREEVDGEKGFGRVKNAKHWLAVHLASWQHPYGYDSSTDDLLVSPVVHVSHKDATEYCAWAGLRLPTEREWEFAARGGLVNQSFPWGDDFKQRHMNIWEGNFPSENKKRDGYLGVAPVGAASRFPPNAFGLFNMVGNVWEWVRGGKQEARILRGGSFVDSLDGKFNHAVRVSTRQTNSGDSAATNIGFRCAGSVSATPPDDSAANTAERLDTVQQEPVVSQQREGDHIEL